MATYGADWCPHINANGLIASNIASLAVQRRHLATNAVSTVKVLNFNITASKVGTRAITTVKLATSAVTATKIANLAVGTAKLATNAVTATKVANYNISTIKLATAAVSTLKVADYNITTAKLATNAVSTGKVVNGNLSMGGAGGTHLAFLGDMNAKFVSLGTVTAAVNHVVSHGLGRTPVFWAAKGDKKNYLYDGTTAHTDTLLNLAPATTATTVWKIIAI